MSLQIMLEEVCDVWAAETPDAAVAALTGRLFDCAVIDWRMPGRLEQGMPEGDAGAELLRRVHMIDRTLAAIIWTACGQATKRAAIQLGAFTTMPKPIEPDEARRIVIAAAAETMRRRGSNR